MFQAIFPVLFFDDEGNPLTDDMSSRSEEEDLELLDKLGLGQLKDKVLYTHAHTHSCTHTHTHTHIGTHTRARARTYTHTHTHTSWHCMERRERRPT